MEFDRQEFDKFLLENNVVGIKEEPFKLKSGRISHWYANCRVLSDTFQLLDRTAQFVHEFLQDNDIDFDYVYGVPAGATKLAVAVNYNLGLRGRPDHKIIIGREKPKEHGDPRDRYFIGPLSEGDKAVVLEDVTTTGGSVISEIKKLKEAGVEVTAVVALVNRLEKRDDGMGVAEYIKKEFGIPYHWLSDAKKLLPMAAEGLSDELKAKVRENVNQHSAVPVEITKTRRSELSPP
ncbi:MAG: hypothetical protein R6U32_01010 [Candidatus Woesearchaeota archaeon]